MYCKWYNTFSYIICGVNGALLKLPNSITLSVCSAETMNQYEINQSNQFPLGEKKTYNNLIRFCCTNYSSQSPFGAYANQITELYFTMIFQFGTNSILYSNGTNVPVYNSEQAKSIDDSGPQCETKSTTASFYPAVPIPLFSSFPHAHGSRIRKVCFISLKLLPNLKNNPELKNRSFGYLNYQNQTNY